MSRKFKLVQTERAPHKFKVGDRVKPTALAISLLWDEPGVVEDCGEFCVKVRMDQDGREAGWYDCSFWEKE